MAPGRPASAHDRRPASQRTSKQASLLAWCLPSLRPCSPFVCSGDQSLFLPAWWRMEEEQRQGMREEAGEQGGLACQRPTILPRATETQPEATQPFESARGTVTTRIGSAKPCRNDERGARRHGDVGPGKQASKQGQCWRLSPQSKPGGPACQASRAASRTGVRPRDGNADERPIVRRRVRH